LIGFGSRRVGFSCWFLQGFTLFTINCSGVILQLEDL